MSTVQIAKLSRHINLRSHGYSAKVVINRVIQKAVAKHESE